MSSLTGSLLSTRRGSSWPTSFNPAVENPTTGLCPSLSPTRSGHQTGQRCLRRLDHWASHKPRTWGRDAWLLTQASLAALILHHTPKQVLHDQPTVRQMMRWRICRRAWSACIAGRHRAPDNPASPAARWRRSMGQNWRGRGRWTWRSPSMGRHVSTLSRHCTGAASRPWTAPRSAPAMAALVSVSPPAITELTTPSSRLGAWSSW